MLGKQRTIAWILLGSSEPLTHFFHQCYSVSQSLKWLVREQESQKCMETYLTTNTLNGIKPSVSFPCLQEAKMHRPEVREGRKTNHNEYEVLQQVLRYGLQNINPVQTVQSLSLA